MAPKFHSLLNSTGRNSKEKAAKKAEDRASPDNSSSRRKGGGKISMAMDDEDDVFGDAVSTQTPLCAIADAFEGLCDLIKSKGGDFDLDLKSLCDASSHVAVLFGCLGIAFKFAEMEYCSKLRDLRDASETYETLQPIIENDMVTNTVKNQGSLSRKLRRVRQGLDLVRAIFQNFLSVEFGTLKEAASVAYADVCAPFHSWPVRTAVSAGMCALPTREQLLERLNETNESAGKAMRRYIKASGPVIEYIDNLYTKRNITLDW